MLRRPSLLTVVLLILAVGFLITDVSHLRPEITGALQQTASVVPKVREPEDAFQKARDWFMFQRTYPFDSVPAGVRLKAWKARPKQRLEKLTLPGGAESTLSWQPIGPMPVQDGIEKYSGHIQSIAVSPLNPDIVLVGSVAGGIWRSTDGGNTLVPVSDDQVDLEVGSIAFAPSNPQIVYAGMGGATYSSFLGSGVLKSIDAGQTWRRVSNDTLPTPGTTSKIAVSPTNPNRVYLAQRNGPVFSSGFWVSTDGGTNWVQKLPGITVDFAIDPAEEQKIYLSMSRVDQSGNPAPGVYRSVDAGNTWTHFFLSPFDPNFPDIRIGISPQDPQTIYLLCLGSIGGTFSYRVFRTTDGGVTWSDRNATGLQSFLSDFITVSPTNPNTVYIGQFDLMRSDNGGATWTPLSTNKIHIDQHALAFSPVDPNVMFIGNDGGLYKTTNSGQTYQSLNDTLSLTQFYGLTLHPTDPMKTFGGTQDNGTEVREQPDLRWRMIAGGDGGPFIINPLDPRTVFVSYQFGFIWRLGDGGITFEAVVGSPDIFGEGQNLRVAFIPPFTGNGVNPNLYFGTWRLFVSTDLGNSWTAPAGSLDLTKGDRDVLSTISVARADPNTIYTGSAQGRVMVTTDGGFNWSDITAGLPNRYISDITIDSDNPAVAYLSVSGYGSAHVFKTTDRGASWIDISGNLPDIPTNALLVDPTNKNIIYAGTDIGVFRSTSAGNNWENFNNGMPPAVVFAFAALPGGLIRLATHGRGVYELTGTGRPLANAVDEDRFFVSQQYLDFLNRAPDPGGLAYWTFQITECARDPLCIHNRRIGVSAAFFIELEFQETGYVVYRLHRAAFGTWPNAPNRANLQFTQFMADRSQLVAGPGLPSSTIAFANNFVQRAGFKQVYPATLTNDRFVNKLFDMAGLTPYTTERQEQIEAMNHSGKSRAQVLLSIIDIQAFKEREHNGAFVLMQYFGYLRRDPDQGGYSFWLDVLNNRVPGNFRGMVCAFLTSPEYQRRFGFVVTRTDRDCG